MFSAMSRTNAVLHCAACSKVRGGTNRVLVSPGTDALAIAAIPQAGTLALPRSRTALRMTTPIPRDTPSGARLVQRNSQQRFAPHRQPAVSRQARRRRPAHPFVPAKSRNHFYCLVRSRGRRAAANLQDFSPVAPCLALGSADLGTLFGAGPALATDVFDE